MVAGEDGAPRAFHNVCRHRGARLLDEPEGRVRRLQCPYHAWSYGFDGVLRNPPDERFDPACFSLPRGARELLHGLVFVDVSGGAPPLGEHVGALAERLAAYRLGELRRAAAVRYDVAANWKAIVQNYSECLHCPGVHPELNRLTHYLSGVDHEGPGLWCGGAMTLNEGVATMGRGEGWPAIAGVDERAVLYYALLPNALVSLHPDYAMLHTLWPRGPGRTEIVCEWFFEPSTIALDGFDPADAVGLLGHRQPPGLARLRAHPEGRRLARVHPRPLHGQRAHRAPVRPDGLRGLPRDPRRRRPRRRWRRRRARSPRGRRRRAPGLGRRSPASAATAGSSDISTPNTRAGILRSDSSSSEYGITEEASATTAAWARIAGASSSFPPCASPAGATSSAPTTIAIASPRPPGNSVPVRAESGM